MPETGAAVYAVDFQRRCLLAAAPPIEHDITGRWAELLREIDAVDPDKRMLAQFRTAHLREDLRTVSEPFGNLARWLVENTPGSPERTLALRKLFEAKNYAVMGFMLAGEEKQATMDAEARTTGDSD